MESITPSHFLILALVLFAIGFFGVLLRRNLLLVLMSLELMLNGINLALVNFSRTALNLDGSIFVFFIMTVAAAEVAVGLASSSFVQKAKEYLFGRYESYCKLRVLL